MGIVPPPPTTITPATPPVDTPLAPPFEAPPDDVPPLGFACVSSWLSLFPQAAAADTLAATTNGNVPPAVRTTIRSLRMTPTSVRRFAKPSSILLGVTFWLVLLVAPAARADECPVFAWQHFGDTGSELARPVPLAFVAGAALAPAVMAPTGLDHELRLIAQEDLGGRHNVESVSVIT